MKKSGRHLTKKGLAGLKRITDKDMKRVWVYRGHKYSTLREVIASNRTT
jgi:hypothetical protein